MLRGVFELKREGVKGYTKLCRREGRCIQQSFVSKT
jgi:hypothetical protein